MRGKLAAKDGSSRHPREDLAITKGERGELTGMTRLAPGKRKLAEEFGQNAAGVAARCG